MTTGATPLSAMRMTPEWSLLNSVSAWASLVMFLLELCECLRAPLFLLEVLLHCVAQGSGMLVPQWQCIPQGGLGATA